MWVNTEGTENGAKRTKREEKKDGGLRGPGGGIEEESGEGRNAEEEKAENAGVTSGGADHV